jgi:hypothetical protein
MWSLEVDGKGNLGGNSLYFDEQGQVTVNGTLFSSRGAIAGFKLSDSALYIDSPVDKGYDPLIFDGTSFGYGNEVGGSS